MAIPERILENWSHQGSIQQSAATYQTIRGVLEDRGASYNNRSFNIFLQGSYGNDTNIRTDSDVDIVICTTEIFYFDTDRLTPADKGNFDRAHPGSGQYTYAQFRSEVLAWLQRNFPNAVTDGSKAITIAASGNRRKADVLVAADFRHYWSFADARSENYSRGIVFWKKDGTRIINYPRQHSENLTDKHQATREWFKPTIRVFKNMRNSMIDIGLLQRGIAPSYYVEGLLSNVAHREFGGSYQSTFVDCMNYIRRADTSQFTCANGIHFLLRPRAEVCWEPENCTTFLTATQRFWDNYR